MNFVSKPYSRMPKIRNPDPYPEKRLTKNAGTKQLADIIDSIVQKITATEKDLQECDRLLNIKVTHNRDLVSLEKNKLGQLKESTKILQYYKCQLNYYYR